MWTINNIEADGLRGPQPAPLPGESNDYPFGFLPTGATDEHVTRFKTLRNYAHSAGEYDIYDTISGDIFWREQETNGPSPLVEVQPPIDNQIAHPFWGLVESVADETMVDNNCILTVSLVYVAAVGTDIGEFSNEADIRSVREVHGP